MTPSIVSTLTPALVPTLIEAALRAFLVALAVWAGLRVFTVRNVLAQKAAWGLVLAAALAMPLAMNLGMRWQLLPGWAAIRVPQKNLWTQPAILSPAPVAAVAPIAEPGREPVEQAAEKVPNSRKTHDRALAGANALTDFAPPAARLKSCPVSEQPLGGGVASYSTACETQAPVVAGLDRFPAPRLYHSASHQPDPAPLPAPEASPQLGTVPETTGEPATRPASSPTTWAGLVYLVVCAVLLMRLLYGLGVAIRLWRAAEPVLIPGEGLVARLAASFPMRASSRIASPVTVGSGVILPADYADWDTEKLRIVLAHERSHIRQGDFYLQLLAGLHACLFWFSPLGWWLKRKLSELAETISDRAGIEEASSRSSYAQVLLEFAALPRPTPIGVAMARTSTLSQRIERLLNDSSFRQAFAGSRSRMLLAVLLVPAALFAATALIRVDAAAAPAAQAAPQAPATPQAPEPAPAPTAAPAVPDTPSSMPSPAAAPEPPELPTPPDGMKEDHQVIINRDLEKREDRDVRIDRKMRVVRDGGSSSSGEGHGYSYSYSSNGEAYALVSGPGENLSFSGDWNHGSAEAIKKASRMAHGKFLWFMRNGKSYIVEDPALLAQLQPLNAQIDALGKQQEALGRQQEELGKKQEELGRQQEQARVPTPDISKEMAKLNELTAKLQAKKGSTVSQEELADLEGQLGDIQGKLGELQGEIGERQGHLGGLQGQLGEQQGKLGEEQGRLGEEQGRLAREADRKAKAIIDESLKNGKARPVD